MSQASITDFFGVRTQKRKYAPNGDPLPKKVALLERDGRVTPERKLAFKVPRKPKAVSRLTFDAPQPSEPVPQSPRDAPKPAETNVESSRKELSLGKIRKAIVNSPRLDELKTRIAKFNEGYEKLKRPEASASSPRKSSLKQFDSIEVVVPASPVKCSPVKSASPLTSPIKTKSVYLTSPVKSPSKVSAYLRYASLAAETPSLTLPHHYRWLAEVFRAVETICSMLHNRKETITFTRIKPAVQDMLKRNITEKHLSQIKHLSPYMYSFTREKVRQFGATAKEETYELVLTPRIINQNGSPVDNLNPEVILERRRSFYNLLIEKVKDHHEAFLSTLDPPMNISRTKLTRWHPEFDLERIPDVESSPLPQPPEVEKYTTAQDMLKLISDKYTNPKIQRALERLAEKKAKELPVSEGTSSNDNKTSQAPFLNPALKNIPSALLAKVKARQAENALKAMTCVQNETSLTYCKLPELARTLHNLFAVEKKNVMSVDLLVTKLGTCFFTQITVKELTSHLKLLSKEAPEWLTLCNVKKTEFVKLLKNADFNKVLIKLENLAEKHNQ